MASTVLEIFTEIPKKFDAAAWGSEDALLVFNIIGDGGGIWSAKIANNSLTLTTGSSDNPSMAMTCSSNDLLAIVNGELSAVSAFMQGKVKIEGNMSLAMKLQNLLNV
jgi:putative sterol carrier protein